MRKANDERDVDIYLKRSKSFLDELLRDDILPFSVSSKLIRYRNTL